MSDLLIVGVMELYDPHESAELESEEERDALDEIRRFNAVNTTLLAAGLPQHDEPELEEGESWQSECRLWDFDRLAFYAIAVNRLREMRGTMDQLTALEPLDTQIIVPREFDEPLAIEESLGQYYEHLLSSQVVKSECEKLAEFLGIDLEQFPPFCDFNSEDDDEEEEPAVYTERLHEIVLDKFFDAGRPLLHFDLLAVAYGSFQNYYADLQEHAAEHEHEQGEDCDHEHGVELGPEEMANLRRDWKEKQPEEMHLALRDTMRDMGMGEDLDEEQWRELTDDFVEYALKMPGAEISEKLASMDLHELPLPLGEEHRRELAEALNVDIAIVMAIESDGSRETRMAYLQELEDADLLGFMNTVVWKCAQLHEACDASIEMEAAVCFC